MTKNPYSDLSERAFWRPAVTEKHFLDIIDLWEPKFPIGKDQNIVTYGSCFAQNIGKWLKERDYQWINAEPAPSGMSSDVQKQFNYGIFSARTGNIYTTSLLYQWVRWAVGNENVPNEVWYDGNRVIDPFRPRVEPKGFSSVSEMKDSRNQAVRSFFESIRCARTFIFTLGLTESWKNRNYGYEYPMCPGTVSGEFDPDNHMFVNQSYNEIFENLLKAIEEIRNVNDKARFLLTVSPVPLTATNSDKHVILATTYSKSVLRAVAGDLSDKHSFIDYFPSYEIFAAPPFRGTFYDTNLRTPSRYGINHAMSIFFNGVTQESGLVAKRRSKKQTHVKAKNRQALDKLAQRNEVVCDEELLETFSK